MSIEKDFVPYNEALALKDLGFNEPCFGFYVTNEVKYGIASVDKNTNKCWLDESFCTAPTFSQAFRFFREKYQLFHSITEYNKDGSLIIEISKDRVGIFRKMENFDFTEYSEAELECLRKLIEICKSK